MTYPQTPPPPPCSFLAKIKERVGGGIPQKCNLPLKWSRLSKAHKVILAAPSPMIPRRNRHPHPLIYLWGIKTSVYNVITCTGLKRQQLKNSGFFIVSQFVCFKMSPQTAHMSKCIVTLVTFALLFSIVYFQMCFKSACTRGFKVTLVAFICLFPNVRFQMSPQMACLTFESCTSEGSLLQLVLLLWPKIDRGCSHIGFICLTFVNCAF